MNIQAGEGCGIFALSEYHWDMGCGSSALSEYSRGSGLWDFGPKLIFMRKKVVGFLP